MMRASFRAHAPSAEEIALDAYEHFSRLGRADVEAMRLAIMAHRMTIGRRFRAPSVALAQCALRLYEFHTRGSAGLFRADRVEAMGIACGMELAPFSVPPSPLQPMGCLE